MADCEACEADSLTEYYDLIGESAKAVDIARPNLEGLRQCKEVPHRVLSFVLRRSPCSGSMKKPTPSSEEVIL